MLGQGQAPGNIDCYLGLAKEVVQKVHQLLMLKSKAFGYFFLILKRKTEWIIAKNNASNAIDLLPIIITSELARTAGSPGINNTKKIKMNIDIILSKYFFCVPRLLIVKSPILFKMK